MTFQCLVRPRGKRCSRCGNLGATATQETLAYEAEVNRSYLSKIEKGATWVGLEIIGKIAAVLEVKPAELLRLPPLRSRRR